MPYELLEEVAERSGLEIDREKFEELLEKQREMSRSKEQDKRRDIYRDVCEKS